MLRQPSSAVASVLGAPLDLGVDEDRRLGLRADLEDQHPAQDPELCGGQADADRVAHQPDHPLGLALASRSSNSVTGEAADRSTGIAELDHLRERRASGARAPPGRGPRAPRPRSAARRRQLLDGSRCGVVAHGFESSRGLGTNSAARRGSLRLQRGYCGSTSTEIETSRRARSRTAVAPRRGPPRPSRGGART